MPVCVCVLPCACIWVWYKHVCTTGRIIKGTNYRQTNELCTLFSQTNEWADFDGTQRRLRNVWRVQAVAWETDDTFLKWFISAQLNNITLMFGYIIFELFLITWTVFCIQYRGHTLSPLFPLGPDTPASPLKPLSIWDKSFISTKVSHQICHRSVVCLEQQDLKQKITTYIFSRNTRFAR